MFCRQCGFEVEPGRRYCINCGAKLGDDDSPPPERNAGPSGRGRKGATVLVVLLVVMSAAVLWMSTNDTDDPDAEKVIGDVTLRGGMCGDDIAATVLADGVQLEYSGEGSARWMWRDACAPVFTASGQLYGETPFRTAPSGVLTFGEPGKYEVSLQVDGRTVHTGYVILDGTVERTWAWSRSIGASTHTYSVDWSFRFSDYLGYREADAVRWLDDESEARFVVVDDDILGLERALSREYAEVHGHEPVRGSQDYADYLLSFVQVCFDYPPMIDEVGEGVFVRSDDGSPDTYLYGEPEYWAYPMETLYMGQGDCEDTSFLASALFSAAGYDSALAMPPGHMMALVALDDYQRQPVFEVTHRDMLSWHITTEDGRDYFFCETTYDTAAPVGYNSVSMARDLESIEAITPVPAHAST